MSWKLYVVYMNREQIWLGSGKMSYFQQFSVLNKDESAITPLFNGPEVLSSVSDKVKLFTQNFSKKI